MEDNGCGCQEFTPGRNNIGSRQHLIGKSVLRVLAESNSYLIFYHSLSSESSRHRMDREDLNGGIRRLVKSFFSSTRLSTASRTPSVRKPRMFQSSAMTGNAGAEGSTPAMCVVLAFAGKLPWNRGIFCNVGILRISTLSVNYVDADFDPNWRHFRCASTRLQCLISQDCPCQEEERIFTLIK